MFTSSNPESNPETFRKLCSKLYFKAEAQEIDRILEVFSHRYYNSNHNSESDMYKSAGKTHTQTLSLQEP